MEGMDVRVMTTVDVSVVVPAYNEQERLPACLEQLSAFVRSQVPRMEVVVVDDGSGDATFAIASEYAAASGGEAIRVLKRPHAGKGGAVRAGVLRSLGKYVVICDVDLSVPVEELARFDAGAFANADILIGTREGEGARRYNEPLHRHIMGRAFNRFVQALLVPGISDTQCGFKALRRPVAVHLCQLQTIDGWAFDVEWLVIAGRHGYRIAEVPVQWYHEDSNSRIHPLRDAIGMTREVLHIRRNLSAGLYDAGLDAAPAAPLGTTQARRRLRAHG